MFWVNFCFASFVRWQHPAVEYEARLAVLASACFHIVHLLVCVSCTVLAYCWH